MLCAVEANLLPTRIELFIPETRFMTPAISEQVRWTFVDLATLEGNAVKSEQYLHKL